MPRELVVLAGGHPYEAEPFAEMLASLEGWNVTRFEHPVAERLVGEGRAAGADAMLFYDMPGYDFADGRITARPPSDAFKRAILARFATGRGAVAMHHALAGWADWPEWSELIGGRFLYQPGEVRGIQRLDSGYRHDVSYQAEVVADHPVTTGLPRAFPIADELYLAQVFEADVVPLIRAEHDFVLDNFYSAAAAVAGRMFDNTDWDHPPGSDLIAWAKRAGNAQLVYLQFGDGPSTYADPNVRRVLANALDFVAARA
ncbi:MAG: ThuA domain-containing protein [Novosphingobium sp.]